MTPADIERIESAAERVRLRGQTLSEKVPDVVAECLGYPLEVVKKVLGVGEEETV